MLRKLLCVKYFRRHIDNHSRDLQASSCARVSIKPGKATRSKRQLLKLSKPTVKARSIATFLLTNLGAVLLTVTKWTAIIQVECHYTERGALTREDLSNLV